jgi:predicted ester cyclase
MIHLKRCALSSIAIAICSLQPNCGGSTPEPTAPEPTPAAEAPKVEAPTPPAPTPQELTAKWYGDCWQLFNDKKWDEFSKCYAEDATASIASMPTAMTGRATIIEQDAKGIAVAFPDIKGDRLLTLINGNHVVSIAVMRGTHTGPLMTPDGGTIPPTGKPVGFLFMHTIETNSAGQAMKQWEVSNGGTLMAQLGLSDAPARPIITEVSPEVTVFAKNDDAETKNVELYKKGYELFSKHDPAIFDLFADDVVFKDPTMPADVVGKAENVAMTESFWKAFSDLKGELDEVWAAGDYVAGFGHLKGTNDGDLPAMGLKKTGKKIDIRFGEIAKVENGKVKVMYPFMDGMDMAAQLGLLDHKPAKKPATKPGAASVKPTASKAPAAKPTGAKPTGKE